jgi:hypothetical protein
VTEPLVWAPAVVANLRLLIDPALTRVVRPGGTVVGSGDPGTTGKATFYPLDDGGAADDLSHVVNVVPQSATVEFPSHRQVGTWSLKLAFRDLPVDPRAVRALAVRVHMGAVPLADFGRGMLEATTPGRTRASMLNVVGEHGEDNLATLLIAGAADTWSVEHTDTGSMVAIEGRDARGILLDSPLPAGMLDKIDLSADIVSVVRAIVSLHPQSAKMVGNIVADPRLGRGGPIPSPGAAATRVRKVAGSKSGRTRATIPMAGQTTTFWDAITQFCYFVGAIPIWNGVQMRIAPATSLFERLTTSGEAGGPDTPFFGNVPRDAGGRTLRVRRLVYGHNLSEVRFERKLAGVTPRAVEVVCNDTSSSTRGKGRLLRAFWPPKKGSLASGETANARVSASDVLRVPVYGVSSQEQLQVMAHALFEEQMRGEIGGTAETKDLTSFAGTGDPRDADMLRLRPGDAVQIGTALSQHNTPLAAELVALVGNDYDAQVAEVTRRVGDDRLARLIVATTRDELSDLSPYFYVTAVRYDWGTDTGLKIAFDFRNYVEARVRAAERS